MKKEEQYFEIVDHDIILHTFSIKSNPFYNIIFCFYALFFIYRYVRLLARYPVVVLLGISVFSISALVCSLMLHDWPDFTDPQAVRAL